MKSRLILVFFIISYNIGWTQGKKYKYSVDEKIYIVDSIYDCIETEFSFVRDSLSKNSFVDYSFYYNGRDTTSKKKDTFKIVNDCWWIKQNSRWVYFFSPKGFENQKHTSNCYLFSSSAYLLPIKKVKNKTGKKQYLFSVREDGVFSDVLCVFDPEIGFVSMSFGRCTIVLAD